MSSAIAPDERSLLEAARAGDHDAYRRLVEGRRGELHAHCYRMLGSAHDAEDALQDALLRAWRGLPRFDGRSGVRHWMYRIATNTCLDQIAKRPRRALPIDHGPAAGPGEGPGPSLAESTWVEPCPDASLDLEDGRAGPEARYERRESVELAFVAALQLLPPRQRAALILRDVLGFSAREAADAMGASVASLNSALQRGRQALEERRPERSQQATLAALGDRAVRDLVDRYMDAMERGDVDAVVAMLTESATWSMPPLPTWFGGRAAVTEFLRTHAFSVRWRHLATHANGQAAVGCYAWHAGRGCYVAAVLDVLSLEGERIAGVTGFATTAVFDGLVHRGAPDAPSELFRRFGLPGELPAERPAAGGAQVR